ncbi:MULTISPECIES: hypothetical protein [unclassified Anaerobiospirillum]|uniref:hypothetical protein n=1 Tax=unclassified Anaerobiospirillum TaxID=2647410 RepID=UPI001FF45A5A|nr:MULTISPECIES: hypothetical protein [unclassified Anaerobiospirillum]MCK0527455.1 hypothetical protein [Anaerobiospirillum sp. NML120449]MCK0535422.1 hypothetical protein [Anaerobiospirillum sp. NML120511]MCK0541036.1 hypothetical protein [Anaerobiospirillum sp. NML02-A-032]
MAFEEKKPSSYIKTNLESGESLKLVIQSSKGFFCDDNDIAITDKRIFFRGKDGTALSFPKEKIKNIEAVPEKGIFGGEKDYGVINVYGPYKKCISFKVNDINNDINTVRDLLRKK